MALPTFDNVIQDTIFPYEDGFIHYQVDIEGMPTYAFIKFEGTTEIFSLELDTGNTYKVAMDMIRLPPSEFMLGKLVAMNADGWIEESASFAAIIERSANLLIKESFEVLPDDWTETNIGSITWFSAAEGGPTIWAVFEQENDGYYTEIDEGTSRGYIGIRADFAIQNIPDPSYFVPLIGCYKDNDEDAIEQGVFLRFERDAINPEKYNAYVVFKTTEGEGYVLITDTPEKQLDHSVYHTIIFKWYPDTRLIDCKIYETPDDAHVFQLKAFIFEQVPEVTIVEYNKFGVRNQISGVGDSEFGFYIYNLNLYLGELTGTYPRIVTNNMMDTSYSPTDVQILTWYYDFFTGEVVAADSILTVEIFDKDDVLVAELTSTKRLDGKYEAFWNTIGVERDTYYVKITGTFGGKTLVYENLINIQG